MHTPIYVGNSQGWKSSIRAFYTTVTTQTILIAYLIVWSLPMMVFIPTKIGLPRPGYKHP